MASTFYAQVASNRRNSFLLAFIVVVLLAALGFSKREFFDAEPEAANVPNVDLSLS